MRKYFKYLTFGQVMTVKLEQIGLFNLAREYPMNKVNNQALAINIWRF